MSQDKPSPADGHRSRKPVTAAGAGTGPGGLPQNGGTCRAGHWQGGPLKRSRLAFRLGDVSRSADAPLQCRLAEVPDVARPCDRDIEAF